MSGHCTCAKLETAVLYAVVNFASVRPIVDKRAPVKDLQQKMTFENVRGACVLAP